MIRKTALAEKSILVSSPQAPTLRLWDAVSILMGIVIGAGIYETAPLVFQNVDSPFMGLSLWLVGGILSVVGALCYAELASTYPLSGGDYIYLTKAYGRWAGFLFGWAQLVIIITGSIGMLGFILADYAANLFRNPRIPEAAYAVLSVVVLSVVNIIGVKVGRRTQNTLTLLTVPGLIAVVLAGGAQIFSQSPPTDLSLKPEMNKAGAYGSIGLALIMVLYTYGGWNDAAFVVSEVKNKRRVIPKALILGTSLVTLVYLLVNASYLLGLGFEGVQSSRAVAADLMEKTFGSFGASFISILVMLSALGSMNGLIFTGSRIYSALGKDHSFFSVLSLWSQKRKSPVWSLCIQLLISIALIICVGTELGRAFMSSLFLGSGDVIWKGRGGFDSLMQWTAPIFWIFFLLTSLSVFILRRKDKNIYRPFKVPFYPVLPLIFSLMCLYMLYSSIVYAGKLLVLTSIPLLMGMLVFAIQRRKEKKDGLSRR